MKKVLKQLMETRLEELLILVKEGTQISLIERELALLAIDIILALKKERGLANVGCQCFLKIDYAITGALRKKLSEEARDLINEMIILDELGDKYGPELNIVVDAAKKILERQSVNFISDARKLVEAGMA